MTIGDVLLDPAIYPNPHKFSPERWLKDNPESETANRFYIPFNKSTRACIGIKYVHISVCSLYSSYILAVLRMQSCTSFSQPYSGDSISNCLILFGKEMWITLEITLLGRLPRRARGFGSRSLGRLHEVLSLRGALHMSLPCYSFLLVIFKYHIVFFSFQTIPSKPANSSTHVPSMPSPSLFEVLFKAVDLRWYLTRVLQTFYLTASYTPQQFWSLAILTAEIFWK
jgi:hypothetical protein